MTENKKDNNILQGVVVEALPNANFKIELADGSTILGHLSGKMRMHYIKVLVGDKVVVEVSPYDVTKGRITKRL